MQVQTADHAALPSRDCCKPKKRLNTSELIPPGPVWLIGAGPGDPDFLTRKAKKLITAADIVFYDALVGQGVLDLPSAATDAAVTDGPAIFIIGDAIRNNKPGKLEVRTFDTIASAPQE